MHKKIKETLSALGLVAAAIAMMAVGIGFIYLVTVIFHTNAK